MATFKELVKNIGRVALVPLAIGAAMKTSDALGQLRPVSAQPQDPDKTLVEDKAVPVFYQHYPGSQELQGPLLPPMGHLANFSWKDLHTGPGQFNFDSIDAYINQVGQNQLITVEGQTMHAPIGLVISLYESAKDGVYGDFNDLTPDWVKATAGQFSLNPDPSRCTTKVAPRYDSPSWQSPLVELFQELGLRYGDLRWEDNKQKKISHIVFGLGIDNETGMETKNVPSSCDYRKNLRDQIPARDPIPGGYDGYLAVFSANGALPPQDLLEAVSASFPNTSLYIRITSGGKERVDGMTQGYNRTIFIDQATITADGNNERQSNGAGTRDLADRHPNAWQTALHTWALGPTNEARQRILATIDAALTSYPTHIELLNTWTTFIKGDPELAGLIKETTPYLGKDLENSPGVFAIFRETDNQPVRYGSVTYSGQIGNYERGLTLLNRQETQVLGNRRNGDSPAADNPPLPYPASDNILGLRARQGSVFHLQVADIWANKQRFDNKTFFYTFKLRVVNTNEPITIRYKNTTGAVIDHVVRPEGQINDFVTVEIPLINPAFNHNMESGADISILGNGNNIIAQSVWLEPLKTFYKSFLPQITTDSDLLRNRR